MRADGAGPRCMASCGRCREARLGSSHSPRDLGDSPPAHLPPPLGGPGATDAPSRLPAPLQARTALYTLPPEHAGRVVRRAGGARAPVRRVPCAVAAPGRPDREGRERRRRAPRTRRGGGARGRPPAPSLLGTTIGGWPSCLHGEPPPLAPISDNPIKRLLAPSELANRAFVRCPRRRTWSHPSAGAVPRSAAAPCPANPPIPPRWY